MSDAAQGGLLFASSSAHPETADVLDPGAGRTTVHPRVPEHP
ncbi:hypothetical protein [Nocardia sp. NPDC051750]